MRISLVAALVWGLTVLGLGYWGLDRMLKGNPCEMTYSRPNFQLVPVESRIKGYTLSVHSAGRFKPEPVLFIPGHGGRYI
jgi:hypothetical protein